MASVVSLVLCLCILAVSLASRERFGNRGRSWVWRNQPVYFRPPVYLPYCRNFHSFYSPYCRPYYHYLAIQDFGQCDRLMLWQQDDTCVKVVERFGLASTKDFEDLNPSVSCDKPETISTGQVMCAAPKGLEEIPAPIQPICAQPLMVMPGDNCFVMAERHKVGSLALNGEAICGADGRRLLTPGEILCAKTGEDVPCHIYHAVTTGDSCEKIALDTRVNSTYILSALNPELNCSQLIPGQMLCVYPTVGKRLDREKCKIACILRSPQDECLYEICV